MVLTLNISSDVLTILSNLLDRLMRSLWKLTGTISQIWSLCLHAKVAHSSSSSHHAILLAQVQFAPLSLVIMGAASRLAMLSEAWTTELERLFELLRDWIDAFPVKRISCLSLGR